LSSRVNEQTANKRAHHAVIVLQICTVMLKTPVEYAHLHALVPMIPVSKFEYTLTTKMHLYPCKHARARVEQRLRHANCCNLLYNVRSRQGNIRFHNSPGRSIRCAATQASFDHTPWCGLYLVCLSFAFALGRRRGDHLHKILFPPFSRPFIYIYIYMNSCTSM